MRGGVEMSYWRVVDGSNIECRSDPPRSDLDDKHENAVKSGSRAMMILIISYRGMEMFLPMGFVSRELQLLSLPPPRLQYEEG